MGTQFIDQYTILHMAVGIIAYFWSISLSNTIIIHTIFEIIENTSYGMSIINSQFAGIWPGGKPYADSVINSIGDTIGTALGWLIAYYLDKIGSELKWYDPHLI